MAAGANAVQHAFGTVLLAETDEAKLVGQILKKSGEVKARPCALDPVWDMLQKSEEHADLIRRDPTCTEPAP